MPHSPLAANAGRTGGRVVHDFHLRRTVPPREAVPFQGGGGGPKARRTGEFVSVPGRPEAPRVGKRVQVIEIGAGERAPMTGAVLCFLKQQSHTMPIGVRLSSFPC